MLFMRKYFEFVKVFLWFLAISIASFSIFSCDRFQNANDSNIKQLSSFILAVDQVIHNGEVAKGNGMVFFPAPSNCNGTPCYVVTSSNLGFVNYLAKNSLWGTSNGIPRNLLNPSAISSLLTHYTIEIPAQPVGNNQYRISEIIVEKNDGKPFEKDELELLWKDMAGRICVDSSGNLHYFLDDTILPTTVNVNKPQCPAQINGNSYIVTSSGGMGNMSENIASGNGSCNYGTLIYETTPGSYKNFVSFQNYVNSQQCQDANVVIEVAGGQGGFNGGLGGITTLTVPLSQFIQKFGTQVVFYYVVGGRGGTVNGMGGGGGASMVAVGNWPHNGGTTLAIAGGGGGSVRWYGFQKGGGGGGGNDKGQDGQGYYYVAYGGGYGQGGGDAGIPGGPANPSLIDIAGGGGPGYSYYQVVSSGSGGGTGGPGHSGNGIYGSGFGGYGYQGGGNGSGDNGENYSNGYAGGAGGVCPETGGSRIPANGGYGLFLLNHSQPPRPSTTSYGVFFFEKKKKMKKTAKLEHGIVTPDSL